MSNQLLFGSTEMVSGQLSCFHARVPIDPSIRLKDGWFAAVVCPVCRKKRAVVSVAYAAPSDPTPRI